MSDADAAAVAEIRSIFDELVRYGMDPSRTAGSIDAAIDEMAASQNVPTVPAAVREILRLIGARTGMFHCVGDFNIGLLNGEWKAMVVEFLESIRPDSTRSQIWSICLYFSIMRPRLRQ
ncbi:hypothetical protein [Nocardia sp. R7R-8]|uniref:hypothetical protein n=1 Tax=Nocardia sp. R7R-8 TaxID=3459304 RepID=UPI00403DD0AA